MNTDDDDPTLVSELATNPQSIEIEGYTIQKYLGKGGMGHVLLAMDSAKRLVAIKVLHPEFAADSFVSNRFDREAEILAQLRHPNIVRIYTRGIVDGRRYIVMEYLAGGSLDQLLKKGSLTRFRTLQIAMGVCRGLRHAHAKGIVHRDLKPQNVMFDENGATFIVDFGIAKVDSNTYEKTQTNLIMGTPLYLAPEVAEGRPATDKSDIYAFGLMLCDMMLGPSNTQSWRGGFRDGGVPAEFLGSFPRSSADIARLAGECLAYSPEERPSASEILNRMKAALRRSTSVAKKLKPYKWAILAASAALVALFGLIGSSLLYNDDTGASNPPIEDGSVPNSPLADPSLPKNSLIFVDGKAVTADQFSRLSGYQEAVIVSPGHVGKILSADWRLSAERDLELPVLALPTVRETETFEALFEKTKPLSPLELISVTHWPFSRLLEMRNAYNNQDQREVARIADEHRRLASFGDQGSALVLYLAGGQDIIPDELEKHKDLMRSAGLSGYALASFYIGRHERRIDKVVDEKWSDLARRQGYPP